MPYAHTHTYTHAEVKKEEKKNVFRIITDILHSTPVLLPSTAILQNAICHARPDFWENQSIRLPDSYMTYPNTNISP